ncbi:Protein kinase DC2 [Metarhizium anisopliae]
MAATVAQSQAPANLPSNSLTSPAAPGSHAAHEDHSFHNCQAHSKIQGGQAEPLPQIHRFEPSNFNVVRTLGTGTFARVCLVRPSNAPNIPLERDTTGAAQVYALKILRKTQVIKLKQVDHVRHERAILADVAGHPFITNLLASFSDHDSLYMLLDYGHTTAVDWWALGILIYEFLTGYPPFWHQNPIEIYKQIVEKPVTFPHDPPISDEAKDIICSFCTIDRSRRLGNISGGAARVKAHPFFRNVNWDDLLSRRQLGPIIPPIRYAGDSQCFDVYPEDDGRRDRYTEEMAQQYDGYFADF